MGLRADQRVDQYMAVVATIVVHIIAIALVLKTPTLPDEAFEQVAIEVFFVELSAGGTHLEEATDPPARSNRETSRSPSTSLTRTADGAPQVASSTPADEQSIVVTAAPEPTEREMTEEPSSARALSSDELIASLPQASVEFSIPSVLDRSAGDDLGRTTMLSVDFKPKITVAIVVREAARALGFWPPGYTDSPCPMIRKTLDQARTQMGEVDPGDIDALLKAQARYCS